MSQGTPRKFSEKIAIIERKQNEEKEQFHSVMRDVRAITSKSPTSPLSPTTTTQLINCYPTSSNQYINECQIIPKDNKQQEQLLMHPLAWNRAGGSLPNVHQMLQPNLQQQITPQQQFDYQQQWNYIQQQTTNDLSSAIHQRMARSPGAAVLTLSNNSHYHPYNHHPRNNSFNKSNDRLTTIDTNHIVSNIHLQPPDMSWTK